MSEQSQERVPTEISLHSKSRLLIIEFSDGERFELPCEYLRVFSKAKEVRTLENPVTGKEGVNITRIEPQGQYAVRLVFDDGHDTGIYSWNTLYDLGKHQQANWDAYLKRLQELGYDRKEEDREAGPVRVRLLYFTYLVKLMRKDSEEVELPAGVTDVQSLIEWIRKRHRNKAHLFREGSFQVTVNRQFSEPFTRLEAGDEIAFIPTSPIAPVEEKK
jgi:DUF971 family protein/molybdopterin converting factor small subunit